MSSRKKHSAVRPLKQSTINRILASNPKQEEEQKPPVVAALPSTAGIRMSRRYDYDTLFPEQRISEFLTFIRDAESRYNENLRLIEEYQAQKTDLDHYMELSENLTAAQGYKYYRLSREMWRKRRACKNEVELLQPLISFVESHPELINGLKELQGRCGKAKESIDQREYVVRTNILDSFEDKKDDRNTDDGHTLDCGSCCGDSCGDGA